MVYNRSVKSFFALHSVDAKGNTVLHGSHNAARRFLDGINYVSESIVGVSAKPTKFVSSWVTDKIAPSYWIPNAQIKVYAARVDSRPVVEFYEQTFSLDGILITRVIDAPTGSLVDDCILWMVTHPRTDNSH